MIYVHVTNGVADNRAVFAAEMPVDWPDRNKWHANEIAQIGWRFVDGAFIAPPPGPEVGHIPSMTDDERLSTLLAMVGLTTEKAKKLLGATAAKPGSI